MKVPKPRTDLVSGAQAIFQLNSIRFEKAKFTRFYKLPPVLTRLILASQTFQEHQHKICDATRRKSAPIRSFVDNIPLLEVGLAELWAARRSS